AQSAPLSNWSVASSLATDGQRRIQLQSFFKANVPISCFLQALSIGPTQARAAVPPALLLRPSRILRYRGWEESTSHVPTSLPLASSRQLRHTFRSLTHTAHFLGCPL